MPMVSCGVSSCAAQWLISIQEEEMKSPRSKGYFQNVLAAAKEEGQGAASGYSQDGRSIKSILLTFRF
jgi:hypothetical protein